MERRYICPITRWEFTAADDLVYLKFCDEYSSQADRNIVFLSYEQIKSLEKPNALRHFLSTQPQNSQRPCTIQGSTKYERLIKITELDGKQYVYYSRYQGPYNPTTEEFVKFGEYIDIEIWRPLLKDFLKNLPLEDLRKYIR